jgi:hypothetical protein
LRDCDFIAFGFLSDLPFHRSSLSPHASSARRQFPNRLP